MKKVIVVLVISFFSCQTYGADSLTYRANISANYYSFTVAGNRNGQGYYFPANSVNVYFSHGKYKTVKSDSNFIIQLGFVNTNYFQRTFYSQTVDSRLNIADAAMDNGLGIARMRIKRMGNFSRETKLTLSVFIKTFYTNTPYPDFKRFQKPSLTRF